MSLRVGALAIWLASVSALCTGGLSTPVQSEAPPVPSLGSVSPALGDTAGGIQITLSGTGLTGTTAVTIGGTACTSIVVVNSTTVRCLTPAKSAGTYDVEITTSGGTDSLTGAFEAWSPTQISGARVYDASTEVTASGAAFVVNSSMVSEEINASWKLRDGHVAFYTPGTDDVALVGGWNPFYSDGLGNGGDGSRPGWPSPRQTTNEVWKSTNGGKTWSALLADGNAEFERRHTPGIAQVGNKWIMVGGDLWVNEPPDSFQRDIVSSTDGGLNWTTEMATTPWSSRMLHLVTQKPFAGKIWMFGGQDGILGVGGSVDLHNDVWNCPENDLDNWTQVIADGAASATRPSGRGGVSNLIVWAPLTGTYAGVERMWLVGGCEYGSPHVYFNEVWSTTDGITWVQHADAGWTPRFYHSLFVLRGRLWMIAGGDDTVGNKSDLWYTEDGETWVEVDARFAPLEAGSHADAITVLDNRYAIYAMGNGSLGAGPPFLRRAWRIDVHAGTRITAWGDRGAGGIDLSASGVNRPLLLPAGQVGGFAHQPAVVFDGADHFLSAASVDIQAGGYTRFFVGRIPHRKDDVTPSDTTVQHCAFGNDAANQYETMGLTNGALAVTDGSVAWALTTQGPTNNDDGFGSVKAYAVTRATGGDTKFYIDGVQVGTTQSVPYNTTYSGWKQIGAGLGTDSPTSSNNKLQGAFGAFVTVNGVISSTNLAKLTTWGKGKFVEQP
jgi:hypothetical protein